MGCQLYGFWFSTMIPRKNIPQNQNIMILLEKKKHPSHNSTSSLLFPIIFAPTSRGGSAALSKPSTFTRTKKRGSSEYLSWRGRCRATQRTKRFLLGSASSSSSQNAWETAGMQLVFLKAVGWLIFLRAWNRWSHSFLRGKLLVDWSWLDIVRFVGVRHCRGDRQCLAGCHTSWNQKKWLGSGNKQQNLSTSTTTLW